MTIWWFFALLIFLTSLHFYSFRTMVENLQNHKKMVISKWPKIVLKKLTKAIKNPKISQMVTQCHKLTILRNQNDKSYQRSQRWGKRPKMPEFSNFSKLFEKQSTSQNSKILKNTPKYKQYEHILQKDPRSPIDQTWQRHVLKDTKLCSDYFLTCRKCFDEKTKFCIKQIIRPWKPQTFF